MALSTLIRSACCLLALSVSAVAQDPFGSSNPFGDGGKKQAKKQGSTDPFGGGGTNPFGRVRGPDPFQAGGGSSDPFGVAAKQAKPAPQRAESAAAKNPNSKLKTTRRTLQTDDRIRGVLDGETTQTFIELPLEAAVQLLAESHDIPIVIDGRSLEEFGLALDAPVNLSLKRVSLRSFLRLMLRDLDLAFIVKDEVLQITTPEIAKRHLILRTYPIPAALVDNSEQMLRALTVTVNPDQWSDSGGPCNAAIVGSVLVVSATESGHHAVSDFLEKLEAAIGKKK